ncbi:hypothetical protein O1M54_00275 [Streptomyces diastatochromogenes]|nr:hypothetical protein [Streptomyces diastatochromogenes]
MNAPDSTVQAMIEGRRADTGRRRQRVLAVLAQAAKEGSDVSVAAIACRASVDRTFLYRHRDLLGQVHAQAAEPPTVPAAAALRSAGPPAGRPAGRRRPNRPPRRPGPPPRTAPQRGAW